MSKTIYLTNDTIDIFGISKDNPIYRDEEGFTYLIGKEFEETQAYPLIAADKHIKLNQHNNINHVSERDIHLGPPENLKISNLSWVVHKMPIERVKSILNDTIKRVSNLEKQHNQLVTKIDELETKIKEPC